MIDRAISNKRCVLVTGAQGFVGQHLCRHLVARGHRVRAAVRCTNGTLEGSVSDESQLEVFETGELTHFVDWPKLLKGIDAVVHLIARTHITDEFGASAMSEYRRINVDLSRRLAKASIREGVKQFVYMSSIKAVGNGQRIAYSELSTCRPEDSYGITKLEAEQELRETLEHSGCQLTMLRPPLIYGPGVGGNFLRLIRLVERGVPLPGVSNARSMVHIDNLVDVTEICLRNDSDEVRLFHVADQTPISTANLVRQMAKGLGRRAILLPVPARLLTGIGQVAGKTEEMKRLVGSLTISTARIERELNWIQRIDTLEGVSSTCRAYAHRPWAVDSQQAREQKSVA